jgi:aspartate aminotransferase
MSSKMSSVIRKMFEEGGVLKKKYGPDAVFDFSLGNPDLETPPEVEAAISRIAGEKTRGCHGYMPNAGYDEARAQMARKVGREQGVTLEGSHVVMTCGAAAALTCVLKAVLSPGDEVLANAPFFPEYAHYTANHGGALRVVPPALDFSLNIPGIQAALSAKTAAVIINSPNNPSGRVYGKAELEALAGVLTAHRKKTGRWVLLIADEPYRDIVYENRTVQAIFPLYDCSVVVSSFAKNLSIPGERVGYIAANPAMGDAPQFVAACIFANRILGFVNAPAFFQRVAAASWDCAVDYSPYTTRRNAIMAVMRDAGYQFAVPEGAFYLFCRVPASTRDGAAKSAGEGIDLAFCDHLKEHLVLCAPASGFGCQGWFRIAYCVPQSTIENCGASFKKAKETW